MFKIATILRTKQTPNLYRRTLLNAFSQHIGDEYLLCSGFFQEKKYKITEYYASESFVANPPDLPCQMTLTTVGVYDKRVWKPQYDDFVKALGKIRCRICRTSINVKKRVPKTNNKWHAKIFIVRRKGIPQLAVIGSSNITKNAFDEMKGWNRECDAVIWSTSNASIDTLVRQSLTIGQAGENPRPEDVERQHEIVVSRYDGDDPLNSFRGPMDHRLNRLWDDIMDATQEV